jgi:dihydroxyacetone kinase-like predicted kinase
VGAALQAATLAGLNNVTVLPTKNMAQGYYAKAMDLGDEDEFEQRLDGMRQGGEGVQTIAISIASRDFTGAINCKKGEYIALLNETPVCSSSDFAEVLRQSLRYVPDIDEKENCIAFKGYNVSVEIEETVRHTFDDTYSDIECEYIDGGQGVFVYIIGF